MPFGKFWSSAEEIFRKASNSESADMVRKLASEASSAVSEGTASISGSFENLASTFSSGREGHAPDDAEEVSANYESLSALKPVQKLLAEAGAAIGEKTRILVEGEIGEALGAAGGAGAGVAAGAGILAVGAGSGLTGAAALTSGLATAGGIVGGGMVAGIGVVAAPAVVLGAAGVWAVSRHNRIKLTQSKELLLQEALRKRDALMTELHATNASNRERVSYLSKLVAQLQAAVEGLQADIGPNGEIA